MTQPPVLGYENSKFSHSLMQQVTTQW